MSVSKVIWLNGDRSEQITSGHIDGYVTFLAPGHLLVETPDKLDDALVEEISILEASKDALGRRFRVDRLRSARAKHCRVDGARYNPSYVNSYIANGAIIMPAYGDEQRDGAARETFERAFPGRVCIDVDVRHLMVGGGGLRCLTQPIF